MIAGGLIGAFLVGRPFPSFFKMFQYAASTHDPAFGAAAFVLQVLGNITLIVGLYLAVARVAGARLQRWLAAIPDRLARFSAAALICPEPSSSHIGVCACPRSWGSDGGPRFREADLSRARLWELLLYRRGNWVP